MSDQILYWSDNCQNISQKLYLSLLKVMNLINFSLPDTFLINFSLPATLSCLLLTLVFVIYQLNLTPYSMNAIKCTFVLSQG